MPEAIEWSPFRAGDRFQFVGSTFKSTNVISEIRKGTRANPGVGAFFKSAVEEEWRLFLSVVTVGELRRGVEQVRWRGDVQQAECLERWLTGLLADYQEYILGMDQDIAQLWGRLRAPHPENALDKQIDATALIHDLTVVTRNHKGFAATGIPVLDPFTKP